MSSTGQLSLQQFVTHMHVENVDLISKCNGRYIFIAQHYIIVRICLLNWAIMLIKFNLHTTQRQSMITSKDKRKQLIYARCDRDAVAFIDRMKDNLILAVIRP